MIMKTIAFKKVVLASLVLALVVPVFADDPMPATQMMTAADFAWDAAIINLEEIRLGEVAQTNSQNKAVRKFGKEMVRDHSKMEQHLEKIAADEGLQLPDTNIFYVEVTSPEEEKQATEMMAETPEQRLLHAQLDAQHLASLSRKDFDQAYADAMVKGHEKAIQEFEDASGTLQDPALKKYADKGLKIIRHHYEMAQTLQSKVTPSTSPSSPPM